MILRWNVLHIIVLLMINFIEYNLETMENFLA